MKENGRLIKEMVKVFYGCLTGINIKGNGLMEKNQVKECTSFKQMIYMKDIG